MTITAPGGRLEWPCRLVTKDLWCPICHSSSDTAEDKTHRRDVLQAARERERK